MVRAFTTYVRPLLEYCTPVWSPYFIKDIELIENVQRSFTRKLFFLCGLPSASCVERLAILGLERLELRRIHNDLKLMFKITNGLVKTKLQRYLKFAPRANMRGHRFKLHILPSHKQVFSSYFLLRVAPMWNVLPDDCFNPNTVSAFKWKIANVDFTKFYRGRS